METFQATRAAHLNVGCSLPLLQLSYSHMQPMGWNDTTVPSRAPINEIKLSKMGIPLAMTYAHTAMVNVQPIHVVQ